MRKKNKKEVLSVRNISFAYAQKEVLFKEISFGLAKGEVLSLIGWSGAGKSTMLKCLSGLLPLTTGEILISGEKLKNPKEQLIPGHHKIALVHQAFELEDFFTVRENISNQLHHLSLKERTVFTEELMSVFQLLKITDLKSKEISGGEKQRLSMACALAKDPECLLLDEPFVHLDVHLRRQITDYLQKQIKKRNMGVILVTHNGIEALEWSDRIIVLKNGKISSEYTPKSAYYQPKNLQEGQFFGELNSFYKKEKQILFRPNEFSLNSNGKDIELEVEWQKHQFRGSYLANYFKLKNGRKIVLYSSEKMNNVTKIYVGK